MRTDGGPITHPFTRVARSAPVIVLGTIATGATKVAVLGRAPIASPDSTFEVGSVTKTLTALLLADMVNRNEVSLTDPLSRFLGERTSNPALSRVRLLDLATHTARFRGVPRDLLWDALRHRSDPYARYTSDRLHSALRRVASRRGIGTKFRYSNFGFAVLGHALEAAADRPYETLVRERVCEPLRLDATTFSIPASDNRAHVVGHKRSGKPVPSWNLASFAPAGGLRSSARDLLTYVGAHLHADSSGLGRALTTVQERRVEIRQGRLDVGLAWLIMRRHDQDILWHNGGTGGFSSFVGFSARSGVGLVALANARVAGRLTRAGLQSLESLARRGSVD